MGVCALCLVHWPFSQPVSQIRSTAFFFIWRNSPSLFLHLGAEHWGLPRLSDFILSIRRDKESDWKFINSWVTYAWAGLIPPLLYWCYCSQGERAASAMQHTHSFLCMAILIWLFISITALHSATICHLNNRWRNEKGQSQQIQHYKPVCLPAAVLYSC